jgi:hypothetical protein
MSRSEIPNRTIPILLCMDGLLAVLAAVFAHFIGLDPNPGWGSSRYALFVFGGSLIAFSVYLLSGKTIRFISLEWVKTIVLLGHVWGLVFVVYAWFITYGNFATWQNSTRYYGHLADAFTKGQLFVDIKPNEELLAARDPYDSEDRPHFDDEIWDMSLYKEKLYIYWGPVPALLLTPFQAFSSKPLHDIYLVYVFFCGLFMVNSLFILQLWRQFFADVPLRHVLAAMALIAFILPILWSLNVPEVYEAAIGAGQFFLIGGIYFSFWAMTTGKKGYLFLAGLFWACSAGSRAINVFSLGYLCVVMVLWIFKERSGSLSYWKKSLPSLVLLAAPLAIGAILLGLYNWARFDSPFEFGLRYQITIYNLNRDMHLTFQPDYFPFNLYAYFLQPFDVVSKFPFIQPVKFSEMLSNLKIIEPKLYAAGPMTGILFSTPFLFLAFVNFFSTPREPNRRYVLLLLAGSLLVNSLVVLFYFYGQMRFLVDFVSPFALLAILGYWELVRRSSRSASKRTKRFVLLVNTLLVMSLIFSFLLSFSSEANRMEKSNPALMEKINSFFMSQPN